MNIHCCSRHDGNGHVHNTFMDMVFLYYFQEVGDEGK